MLIRLFNPNDLIGCGGNINQSGSEGLCGSMQVYASLHGGFFKGWWEKNQHFMLIRLFNPNDLIGCGGDINRSDSVGLHGSIRV